MLEGNHTNLMTTFPSRKKAYLVLALSLIAMGFSAIFVSLAGAPGAVSAFYRMAIAVIVLTLPFFRGLRHTGRPGRHETLIALLAGLFFAADLFFWNSGILISGATNPTLMGNISIPWVGVGAMILFASGPAGYSGRVCWWQ